MLPPSRSATREPLAATQTADIRALLGAGDEDRVAVAHFLVGALFLVLAGIFQLFALFSLRVAGLSPISYGRAESMELEYESTSPAVSAAIDPDQLLQLDDDRANNRRTLEAPRRAAAIWATRWAVWLQDSMLTYAWLF